MVGRRTITINDKEVAIRSYEVSIWTLQDSFITVLKWANLENKGQIQQPKMILDVDGTENFSFSIPMYLKIGEENPAWYNTLNGNLMMGMRKIKVILNKTLEDEKVFEFLITKVTERHETEQLYCDVQCEGLAFHELGKIGYKVALSLEEFQFDYDEWFENGKWKKADGTLSTSEPVSNIQYWNEKTGFLLPYPTSTTPVPNKWYYKIEMNWDSYNSAAERESDRVYEDEYVSSWESTGNTLTPSNVQNQREKCRIVDISESNIYNITQKIAETFGVFCRYEYEYDANYHIISRTVVYYNNFIEEQHGHMDLTYPYHTSEITREMDSSELTTKLFVRPVDYDYSGSGQITILSVDANKSREDYILNFDYLHKFNIITDEQYAEIAVYEKKMHDLNLELEQYAARLDAINNQLIDVGAKKTIATNGVAEAEKQLNYAEDHVKALQKELTQDNPTGAVTIQANAPKSVIVLVDENGELYVKMPFVGIIPSTVKLYDGIIDYTKEDGHELDDAIQITGGTLEYDENFDDLIKIANLPQRVRVGQSDERDISSSLWLTCEYVPYTYWMKISKYWGAEKDTITKEVNDVLNPLYDSLESELNTLTVSYETALEAKRVLIKEFEEMMGPALREGYWQPENYNDYGDKYSADFSSISSDNIQGKAKYFYDTNWYSGNNKLSYFEGEQEKQYLVVNLSGLLSSTNLKYIKDHYDDLSFIYCDKATVDLNNELINSGVSESSPQGLTYIRDMKKSIHIGGECRFSFVQNNNNIFPALIIETSKLMTDNQINFFIENTTSKYYSQIGVLSYDENYHPIVESGAIVINNKNYYITSSAQEVYPRIIINSLSLKSDNSSLLIKLGNTVLTNNEDYSVVINGDQSDLPNTPDKYFIDIKSEVYFKMGNLDPALKINYELSNADILTYLDALQVSKENAQPKVAYTIKLSMYDPYIIHTIYKKMSKIVHINDNQLKFENVQGYISHIEMMLDTPWDDTIEVKNYKTKFEDLFSNIVAQTDSMQKRSFGYDVAAMAFNSNGSLTDSTVSAMLANNISIVNAYLDSYFDTSEVVKEKLTDIFTEAGEVLNSAGNALQDIKALNSKNADILAGFVRGAEEGFAKGIDLISSKDGEYTSAVQINQEGIFIGSDQRVALYSGVIGDDGGTSIELNPQHLLLGVSDNSQGTSAEFTKQHIILAAGGVLDYTEWQKQHNYVVGDTVIYNNNHYKCKTAHKSTNSWDNTKWKLIEITGTSSGLVGAKFTKDSIGFATGSGNNINAILMNDKGITLGSGSIDVTLPTTGNNGNNLRASSGSYVRIADSGIELGSLADLYINTNNFKLQTNASATTNSLGSTVFAIGTNLNNISASTNPSSLDNDSTVNFLVNQNGAYIKGTVYAAAGSFTGTVQATSFSLGEDGHSLGINDVANLNTSLSTLTTNLAAVNAISAEVKYQVSTSGTTTPTGTWSSTVPNVPVGQYLWTRTIVTYSGGNTSTSYSISYNGTNGTNGISISTITPLYYLKNNTTAPSKPNSHITSTSTSSGGWRVVVPTWQNNYYYFRCEEYLYSDNTYGWSDPYIDYGITVANQTATSASNDASLAKAVTDAFTANGLQTNYWWPVGTGDNHTNGKQWKVALTSTDNLLIGANTGLWIAKSATYSDGAALVIDHSGIALNGTTINIKAQSSDTTSVISLNKDGIIMGTSGKIKLLSTNFIVNTEASTNNAEIFKVGDTNSYIKYIKKTGTNAQNELQIKGNVVATSFQLASGAQVSGLSYNDLSDKPTIPDPSSFTVNGLGYTSNWNSTGESFVTLTSSAGLLIGSNEGIVVPSSNNAAGLTNPYLSISEDGIVLNGKHILINGQQEWSRDDIIIMKNYDQSNPNWDQKQEWIEYAQRNKTDWVLIKPYYNAQIVYSNTQGVVTTTGTAHDIPCTQTNAGQAAFPEQAGPYSYNITIKYKPNDDNTGKAANGRMFHLYLKANYGGITEKSLYTELEFPYTGSYKTTTVSITLESPNVNLCPENYTLVLSAQDATGNTHQNDPAYAAYLKILEVTVTCSCQTTTSRAICTTYYYPNTQTISRPSTYQSGWPNY